MEKEKREQRMNNIKIRGVNFFRCFILIVVFIWCFTNTISEDGINHEKIVNNINTYFMYTFILCNYILIKTKAWYSVEKNVKKLSSIDDIKKISLDKNCDRDSVRIVSRGNINFIYDVRERYYLKIRKTFKRDIVFLGVTLFLVVFLSQNNIQKWYLYVFQMIVTAFVNIVLLISEIEGKELCFSVFNLKTCSENLINNEYYKLQTNIIQKEEIVYYAEQPYFIVSHIKINKIYRMALHISIGIILLIGFILGLSDFRTFIKNQFLLQLYPSLILFVIGYFDIANIRHSIFQHNICINEIKNISSYKKQNENEIQVLFYEVDEKNKNSHNLKYYQLSIIQMSEWKSLKEKLKRRFGHKLRMKS